MHCVLFVRAEYYMELRHTECHRENIFCCRGKSTVIGCFETLYRASFIRNTTHLQIDTTEKYLPDNNNVYV